MQCSSEVGTGNVDGRVVVSEHQGEWFDFQFLLATCQSVFGQVTETV